MKVVEDCHRQFPPLTEIGRGCCLVTVGKGGEYNDIQGAVNAAFALQKQSSNYNFVKICILPGRYQLDASVVIQDGRRIIISGCDRQAKIEGPSNKPAFQLEECNIIIFDALEIVAASGQEAILVNDSQKIIVTNCGISNGKGSVPSVSIQANFVRIVGNILHSLWIRDGSEDILIQDNEFMGKDGVGIALGSLKPDEKPLNYAAGVSDVKILGNNIQGMSNSGISTVAKGENNLLGIGDVQNLTIAHNRIVGCAREEVDLFFDPEAVGGIVLREVAQVRIHDNYIADNGIGENSVCGIFVKDCQGLDIANNTILDNGYAREQECIYFSVREASEINPRIEQEVSFLVKDIQENPTPKIFIDPDKGLDCSHTTEIELPSPVTSVLLLLHNSTPQSRATVVALDQNNGEVERKTTISTEETLTLSGTNQIKRVVITAPQHETWLRQFCFGDRPEEVTTYQAGIVVLETTSNQIPTFNKRGMLFEKGTSEQPAAGFAARIHDNVVVCPQGQALIVLGLGSMSIIGNTLTSQGIGQQPPVGLGLNILGRCVAIANSGLMPLGSGFVSVDSKQGFANRISYNSSTYATKLSQIPDGRVVFHSNQVTLRVAKRTEPLVYNAVAIISFDDISLQDNQILSEIAGQGTLTLDNNSYTVPPLLIDVFTLAPTVRASGNRFTELPLGALFSYFSVGVLNSATGNQATHCLLIQGGQVINSPNQILIDTFCPNLQFISNPG